MWLISLPYWVSIIKQVSVQPDLMKMRINSTRLRFDLAYCLYAEIDFSVHMIRKG